MKLGTKPPQMEHSRASLTFPSPHPRLSKKDHLLMLQGGNTELRTLKRESENPNAGPGFVTH